MQSFSMINPFCFLSFRISDHTMKARERQRQDTGGKIKKTGHLTQDRVHKGPE